MSKHRKSTLIAAMAAALVATSASAGTIDARFGNTVVATYPDGSTTKFFYNKDGTLTATAVQGANTISTTGKWRVDGANLCVTTLASVAVFVGGQERCVPLNGDKVGDKWQATGKDSNGKDITVNVTIVSGR